MEVEGTILKIGEVETFTNDFTKRLLVVETHGKYPQPIPVEFVKDKTSMLDGLHIGQVVAVKTNLRGSEYKGRYYLNLQGWQIAARTAGEQAPTQQQQALQSMESH